MTTTSPPSPELPSFALEDGKAQFLELLYQRSGRTTGLYTGLWQEFITEVGQQVVHNFALARYQASLAPTSEVNLDPDFTSPEAA